MGSHQLLIFLLGLAYCTASAEERSNIDTSGERLERMARRFGAASVTSSASASSSEPRRHVKRLASAEDGVDYDIYQGVMGRPGVDFPVLPRIPRTTFSCRSVRSSGYYADLDTDCQVFHICDEGRKISFLCPNGTIFRQSHLICDWWWTVDCSSSREHYEESAEQLARDQGRGRLDAEERQLPAESASFVSNRRPATIKPYVELNRALTTLAPTTPSGTTFSRKVQPASRGRRYNTTTPTTTTTTTSTTTTTTTTVRPFPRPVLVPVLDRGVPAWRQVSQDDPITDIFRPSGTPFTVEDDWAFRRRQTSVAAPVHILKPSENPFTREDVDGRRYVLTTAIPAVSFAPDYNASTGFNFRNDYYPNNDFEEDIFDGFSGIVISRPTGRPFTAEDVYYRESLNAPTKTVDFGEQLNQFSNDEVDVLRNAQKTYLPEQSPIFETHVIPPSTPRQFSAIVETTTTPAYQTQSEPASFSYQENPNVTPSPRPVEEENRPFENEPQSNAARINVGLLPPVHSSTQTENFAFDSTFQKTYDEATQSPRGTDTDDVFSRGTSESRSYSASANFINSASEKERIRAGLVPSPFSTTEPLYSSSVSSRSDLFSNKPIIVSEPGKENSGYNYPIAFEGVSDSTERNPYPLNTLDDSGTAQEVSTVASRRATPNRKAFIYAETQRRRTTSTTTTTPSVIQRVLSKRLKTTPLSIPLRPATTVKPTTSDSLPKTLLPPKYVHSRGDRTGLDIPPSSRPGTLHSLALYFGLTDEEMESTNATQNITILMNELANHSLASMLGVTDSKDSSVRIPELLTQLTRDSYSALFSSTPKAENTSETPFFEASDNVSSLKEYNRESRKQKINGDIKNSVIKNSTASKLDSNFARKEEAPGLRELAQVFSRALSAYLDNPVEFRRALSEIRPTEPTNNTEAQFQLPSGFTTTSIPITSNIKNPLKAEDEEEVLDFSDVSKVSSSRIHAYSTERMPTGFSNPTSVKYGDDEEEFELASSGATNNDQKTSTSFPTSEIDIGDELRAPSDNSQINYYNIVTTEVSPSETTDSTPRANTVAIEVNKLLATYGSPTETPDDYTAPPGSPRFTGPAYGPLLGGFQNNSVPAYQRPRTNLLPPIVDTVQQLPETTTDNLSTILDTFAPEELNNLAEGAVNVPSASVPGQTYTTTISNESSSKPPKFSTFPFVEDASAGREKHINKTSENSYVIPVVGKQSGRTETVNNGSKGTEESLVAENTARFSSRRHQQSAVQWKTQQTVTEANVLSNGHSKPSAEVIRNHTESDNYGTFHSIFFSSNNKSTVSSTTSVENSATLAITDRPLDEKVSPSWIADNSFATEIHNNGELITQSTVPSNTQTNQRKSQHNKTDVRNDGVQINGFSRMTVSVGNGVPTTTTAYENTERVKQQNKHLSDNTKVTISSKGVSFATTIGDARDNLQQEGALSKPSTLIPQITTLRSTLKIKTGKPSVSTQELTTQSLAHLDYISAAETSHDKEKRVGIEEKAKSVRHHEKSQVVSGVGSTPNVLLTTTVPTTEENEIFTTAASPEQHGFSSKESFPKITSVSTEDNLEGMSTTEGYPDTNLSKNITLVSKNDKITNSSAVNFYRKNKTINNSSKRHNATTLIKSSSKVHFAKGHFNMTPEQTETLGQLRDIFSLNNATVAHARRMFMELNESSQNALMDMMKQASANVTVRRLVLLLVNQTLDGTTPNEAKKQLVEALLRNHTSRTTAAPPITTYRSRERRPSPPTPTPTPTPTGVVALITAKTHTSLDEVRVGGGGGGAGGVSAEAEVEPEAEADSRAVELLSSLYSLAARWG